VARRPFSPRGHCCSGVDLRPPEVAGLPACLSPPLWGRCAAGQRGYFSEERGAILMTGKLYGLGLGPGDPELITLKAHRILSAAPVVAYPAPDTGPSFARQIAA